VSRGAVVQESLRLRDTHHLSHPNGVTSTQMGCREGNAEIYRWYSAKEMRREGPKSCITYPSLASHALAKYRYGAQHAGREFHGRYLLALLRLALVLVDNGDTSQVCRLILARHGSGPESLARLE